MKLRTIVTIAALFSVAPAFAQQAKQPNTSTGDPNERICEKVPTVGSRLAAKRFCGTRAEWEERKRQDREALESAQKNVCVRKAGCP